MTDQRRDNWNADTCLICPAQRLGLGEFDVSDQPGNSRYSRRVGHRVRVGTQVPVCVHPFRVGLPTGAYASAKAPTPTFPTVPLAPAPAHLEMPKDAADLEAWFIATMRIAHPDSAVSALWRAKATALGRFGALDVVNAMRRVLSVELPRYG